MRMRPDSAKLPVPKPWQAAVRATIDDLCRSLGVPRSSVAVSRVDERPGTSDHEKTLDVWLLARGRGYRYGVDLDGDRPERLGS